MAGQTTIPQLTQVEWTQEGLRNFPWPFTGDSAKQPGGGLYSLLFAMAQTMTTLNAQSVYAFDATRIDTATDTALDDAAKDFYGDSLPRLPGETDADYRIRIKAGFFIPFTTRQAFLTVLTNLLGAPPRLISPWNVMDTSAYDYSYYDVDIPPTPGNPGMPGLYGAPGESVPYQVGIIATLPPERLVVSSGLLFGYDLGAAYDYSSGYYNEAKASLFFGPDQVDAMIKRIKAAGITVWRKYLSQALITYLLANSRQVTTGNFQFPSTVLPIAGPYWVIASGNWNANLYVPIATPSGYEVDANTAAPAGSVINTLVVPFTVEGSGLEYMGPGATELLIPTPTPNPLARLAITPSWNTELVISGMSGSDLVVNFTVPAPAGGHIGWVFMPDRTSATINLPTDALGCTFPASSNTVKPFITTSWATQVSIRVQNGIIYATWNVPAPAGAFVHIGYFTGHGDDLSHTTPAAPPVIGDRYVTEGSMSFSEFLLLDQSEANLYSGWFDPIANEFKLSQVRISDFSTLNVQDFSAIGTAGASIYPGYADPKDGSNLYAMTQQPFSTNYVFSQLAVSDLSIKHDVVWSLPGTVGNLIGPQVCQLAASPDGLKAIATLTQNNSPSADNTVLRVVDVTNVALPSTDLALSNLYCGQVLWDQESPTTHVWSARIVSVGGSNYQLHIDQIRLSDGGVDASIVCPSFVGSVASQVNAMAVTAANAVGGKTYAIFVQSDSNLLLNHDTFVYVANLTDALLIAAFDIGATNNFDPGPIGSGTWPNTVINGHSAWLMTFDHVANASTVLKLAIDGSLTVTPHTPPLVPNTTDWEGLAVNAANTHVYVGLNDNPLVFGDLIA